MDPTKEQHQILPKSRKKCDGDPDNDSTSVRGRKNEPYMETPKSMSPKKARDVKSKVVRSMLIIFVDIKGVVHHDWVKMCQDFAPYFGDKRTGAASRQCTVSHFLFHQGIFYQNNTTFVSHPPYFSVTRLKMKHSEITEVIEAESQAVLNSLTGHDFQDAFKK
jgi:hypothetical protein